MISLSKTCVTLLLPNYLKPAPEVKNLKNISTMVKSKC